MKHLAVLSFLFVCLITPHLSLCQANFELNTEKEKKFIPYMMPFHGGAKGLADFKNTHRDTYLKELWYFSESFYIKRDHLQEGLTLDESLIPVNRFEDQRKEKEESIVILPGFKDAIVLLPANKLRYKPKLN